MAIPGVIGVAEGLHGDTRCILVLVTDDTPEVRRTIPTTLEGHPVRIESGGPVEARDD